MTWQPIETAPKDGSLILLANAKFVYCGRYHRDAGVYDGTRSRIDSGFYFEGARLPNTTVTHWMPLPPPPSTEGHKKP